MDDQPKHTTHVQWLRAALKQTLGVGETENEDVRIDSFMLDHLANTAVREMLNWMVASGKEGIIDIKADPDAERDSPR